MGLPMRGSSGDDSRGGLFARYAATPFTFSSMSFGVLEG